MKQHTDPMSSLGCAAKHIRCLCGKLVARLVDFGIELKCKRCRRLMTIHFSRIEGFRANF